MPVNDVELESFAAAAAAAGVLVAGVDELVAGVDELVAGVDELLLLG